MFTFPFFLWLNRLYLENGLLLSFRAAVSVIFFLLLDLFELVVDEVFEFVDQGLLMVLLLKPNNLTEALCVTRIRHCTISSRLLVNTGQLTVDVRKSFCNLLPHTLSLVYLRTLLTDSHQDVVLARGTRKYIFLLFFPFQNVGGHKLDEFVVENIQNLASNYVEFGLLSRQIVLKHLNQQAAAVNHVCHCDGA